jgi:hypothetical protein
VSQALFESYWPVDPHPIARTALIAMAKRGYPYLRVDDGFADVQNIRGLIHSAKCPTFVLNALL